MAGPEMKCPECGAPMVHERRAMKLEYQGARSSVKVPAWWCTKCGEGVLDGKAMAIEERAFKTLKAKVDNVLSPTEVARIRARLGLGQREASTLLGGGTNAFHKYEKGESAVSTSMSQLLRLLDKHPELVRELKADVAKGMKRAPKPARKAS